MTGSAPPGEARTIINGACATTIDARDRGFTLGDGVFETIRVANGGICAWSRHIERLAGGCRALGFAPPSEETLGTDCRAAVAAGGDGVLRLTVTRGIGPRGYAPPREPQPTRVASFQPGLPSTRAGGLVLRWCSTRLASQPRLAGWKHTNRLEQVLARSEWDAPGIDEGVMCSHDGRVVECTSTNLFWVTQGRLVTPALDDCGVAGVMRALVLEEAQALAWPVEVRDAWPDEVDAASEAFVTSAVRGITAVGQLGSSAFDAPGPAADTLRQRLRDPGR